MTPGDEHAPGQDSHDANAAVGCGLVKASVIRPPVIIMAQWLDWVAPAARLL